MKRQLSGALMKVLSASGTARWTRRRGATVFCYHNVVPDGLAVVGGEYMLHSPLSEFAEQMEWVRKVLTVVSVHELIDRLNRGRPVGGLAVLTFDDGYAGVIRYAVPVMRQFSFPFALFPVVRAATTRAPFWWDLAGELSPEERKRRITQLKGDFDLIAAEGLAHRELPDDMLPASWDELASALGDDCTIGVHGVTHRSLAAIPREEVAWELTGSRDHIAQELGVDADIVAYPYGYSNQFVHDETHRTGFKAGMGVDFGLARRAMSLQDVARVTVPAGIPMSTFACWASGLKLWSRQ